MKNKKILLLIPIFLIVLIGIVFVILFGDKKEDVPQAIQETVELRSFKGNQYYIIKGDYDGEYAIQTQDLNHILDYMEREEYPDIQEIMSYDDYVNYCSKWELEQSYTDESQNYIVFSYTAIGAVSIDVRLAAIESNDDNVNLYIWDDPYGVTADTTFYTLVIPTKEHDKEVIYTSMYSDNEYSNLKRYNSTIRPGDETEKKPVIYLYPEKETKITVELKNNSLITTSYPKYKDGWKVIAKPSGDLVDLKTGRNLYCLYYEAKSIIDFSMAKEGFVIKGEDSASFLEEKLAILGLNEKEAEEFIIYWLPILESNKYNYIRFASKDEIDTNMPLEITPKPDTTIRVLMTCKGLDEPIKVKEQALEKAERTGYTAVEWGGVEIK